MLPCVRVRGQWRRATCPLGAVDELAQGGLDVFGRVSGGGRRRRRAGDHLSSLFRAATNHPDAMRSGGAAAAAGAMGGPRVDHTCCAVVT
eukprot:scaffold1629_cov369-Prasinococcus_capsulatus_cf.AAC.41